MKAERSAFFIFEQLKILSFIHRYYSIDLRALGLIRIGLAIVCLLDLSFRFTDISALYSDEGLWPTKVMYNLAWQPGFWSLHALNSSANWSLILFVLHTIAALFLLVGFRTRWSTLLVLVLYISLHNRNLFVLQAGDDLLRLTLFWGLFLNWGSAYSVDSKRSGVVYTSHVLAGFAYLMLIASVYFFTALLKDDKEWHGDGTALYYALSLEQMRLPFGELIYPQTTVLNVLTHGVYYLELTLPFLILWPSQKGYVRLIAFVLIFVLHISIGLCLYVGLFFLISIVTALGLIPAPVIDKLESRFVFLKQTPLKLNLGIQLNIKHVLIACFVLLCLLINFSSLSWFPYQLGKELRFTTNALRLNQYWGMFSPGILKKDGWMVYHGYDSLGRQWDLRRNADYVDYSKPKHIVSMYKSDRWRKLAENMQNEKFTFLRHLYASHYLKRWNREHPEKPIKTLYLYFMEQETLPDYHKTPVNKLLYAISTAP